MRPLTLLAAVVLAIGIAAAPQSGAAADTCDSTGTVEVLPLHGEIGVHHEVDLVLIANFELNRLVPQSLAFHVVTPKGPHDFPGGDDTLGAKFVAGAVGSYTVQASWQLHGCSDRTVITNEQSAVAPFKVFSERRPVARFKATVVPGRTSSRAPIFAVDAVCPPSTIRTTQPLALTVYWQVGRKLPTHRSAHSTLLLPQGCGSKPASALKTVDHKWGVVRGATIGVLPGNTVRVLAEVKSGKTVVGATRMRFEPRGNREALLRDKGSCTGGCVKRVFKY
jgi:hypothetical protein